MYLLDCFFQTQSIYCQLPLSFLLATLRVFSQSTNVAERMLRAGRQKVMVRIQISKKGRPKGKRVRVSEEQEAGGGKQKGCPLTNTVLSWWWASHNTGEIKQVQVRMERSESLLLSNIFSNPSILGATTASTPMTPHHCCERYHQHTTITATPTTVDVMQAYTTLLELQTNRREAM